MSKVTQAVWLLGLLAATAPACSGDSGAETHDATTDSVVDVRETDVSGAEVDTAPDAVTIDTAADAEIIDTAPDAEVLDAAPDAEVLDTAPHAEVADTAPDVVVADTDVFTADTLPGDDEGPDVDAAPGPLETPWGPIEGEACGTLTQALDAPTPSFHVTTWTFEAETFDPTPLAPGPQQRFEGPNAGGSSKCSEVMSMTWLIECEGAAFYKTETQIIYDVAGSITDYEMIVDGDKIGVSVTRAYLGPFDMTYTEADATTLLTGKLEGVNESTLNVSDGDAWTKQILHIWTLQPTWVPILKTVWDGLDPALKADTVLLVTVESGSDYIVANDCED